MLQIQNYIFMPGLDSKRNWIQGVYVFSYMHKYLTSKSKGEDCPSPLFFLKLVAVRRLHFNYSEL